jgi:hypothetical protein
MCTIHEILFRIQLFTLDLTGAHKADVTVSEYPSSVPSLQLALSFEKDGFLEVKWGTVHRCCWKHLLQTEVSATVNKLIKNCKQYQTGQNFSFSNVSYQQQTFVLRIAVVGGGGGAILVCQAAHHSSIPVRRAFVSNAIWTRAIVNYIKQMELPKHFYECRLKWNDVIRFHLQVFIFVGYSPRESENKIMWHRDSSLPCTAERDDKALSGQMLAQTGCKPLLIHGWVKQQWVICLRLSS